MKEQRDRWHRDLQVAGIDPDDLVFVDEFGAATNLARTRGWCEVGRRLVAKVPHGHWKILTTIGAISTQGMIAAATVDAAVDAEIFRLFAREVLAPVLRPGQVVVMDNLQPHKASGVREAIESAGAALLYLPPYSPDFNPIENAWSKVKGILRSLAQRTVDALGGAISKALRMVAPDDCIGYFRHCGYELHAI